MEQTVAIVAMAVMAVGLIVVIIGIAEFVEMLAPKKLPGGSVSSAPHVSAEVPLGKSN